MKVPRSMRSGGPVPALVLSVAMLLAAPARGAGDAVSAVQGEVFHFAVAGAERGAEVSGELRLPAGPAGRVPLVLILHSSPGFDGRGAFYAEALHRAGIATVEIDYLRGKGIPASPRDNLPHVYQTLQHLARHARIDAARIGVMGFSWGGVLALLASSEELTSRHVGERPRFAAHLGLYPICWRHLAVASGESRWFERSVYQRVTGRPVRILAGARDAFDDPDSCARFVAALPADVAGHFELTVYPEATFGWDSRFGSATYDAGVDKGRGGINRIVADTELAAQSRAQVVAFFRAVLKVD